MAESKYITLMLIPDGTESRRGFRMRQWLFKFIVGGLIVVLVGIVLFFAFYGKVLTRAAMADTLAKENERLLRYQYKVQLLESNLQQARDIVTRLTQLAGINIEFPELPDDSTLFASLDKRGMAVISRSAGIDISLPAGLPIPGFISQDFEIEDNDHYHPGVDIVCARGSDFLRLRLDRLRVHGGSKAQRFDYHPVRAQQRTAGRGRANGTGGKSHRPVRKHRSLDRAASSL